MKNRLVTMLVLSAVGAASYPCHAEGVADSSGASAAAPLARLDESFVVYPLPKGAEAYASIDGRKMHKYVVELSEISRRFRNDIDPHYWGRITGTASDAATAEWLAAKYRSLGLSDVRIQSLALPPQWFPTDWEATISPAGGETMSLSSAQPFHGANPLPASGVKTEAVYGGLGAEADFMGKDVRGKAVFVYGMLGVKNEGGVRRAAEKGAAVVFDVSMLPGNMRFQQYPSGTDVPAFSLGNDDGLAVRAMIETAGNQPPEVRVTLGTRMVPDLKTHLIWGSLPGATDETIYVIAHTDGWFDAAGDNASGVASMIGLAEHYARMPREARRRTLVFVGLDGHHNGSDGGVGRRWMVQNRSQLFSRTALMINVEHPSTIATQSRPRYHPEGKIVTANTYMPMVWYGGGKQRPQLEESVRSAFREFGVPLALDPNIRPPAGDLGVFYKFLPGVTVSEFHTYFHTDLETPETVPWTGLEASTRAFARIIDQVNKWPLSALQRPEEQ